MPFNIDDIKPVVETIMDKGQATRGTYENFPADEKARVATRAAEYGVLSTVRHVAKIWPDRPEALKEGTARGSHSHKVYRTICDRDENEING